MGSEGKVTDFNKIDFFKQVAFYNAGIAPIKHFRHDASRDLSTLSPDEARKLKRKFRKLWRRAKNNKALRVPVKKGHPWQEKRIRANRKIAVNRLIVEKIVLPMLKETK